MNFRYFSIFILLFISTFAAAHQGTIRGVVLDEATRQPLAEAIVQVAELNLVAVTNEAGEFKFKGLQPAHYTLLITYVGYASWQRKVQVVADETTQLSCVLKAGELALDEVKIVSQNAHQQQLINKIDIQLRPILNSQEVLRQVPGLFIGQHAGGGKAEQIFLRGFDIDHGTDIRLTADGIPVNKVSHAHGQGYADLHFIIPELIDNVAFKKGPYQADKGNFTTAGWVDFRMKRRLENNFLKAEVGQFDTYRGVVGINLLKQEKQAAYLASEYSFSNSYFDSPQNFHRLNLVGKYDGQVSTSTKLTATLSHFDSRWNHSGQIPDRAVADGSISFYGAIDDTEGGKTSRTNANLQFYTTTNRGNLWKNQVFYSNYAFDLFSNFTFFLEDPINGDQIRQVEQRNLFGYLGSYAWQSEKGHETHVGVEYRHDLTDATALSKTTNRTTLREHVQLGDVNEANMALYADKTWHFSSKFLINGGLRADFFRHQYHNLLSNRTDVAKSAILLPKLNFFYTPSNTWQLYVQSGKGFHSNDTRVVLQEPRRASLPPAYGIDLGTNWKPTPRLFVNAAAWYLWLAQEFVYVGDAGIVEASGKTARKGFDLSARYQLTKQWFFDTDLNITAPRALEVEDANSYYIPLAPLFTSVGGLTYQSKKALSGSLRYRYMANRPANEDYSIVAKGYFVTDMQLNYVQQRYQLGLSVNNLLNTKWKETQFATESRLRHEANPVEEIHFTAGSPFFARLTLQLNF